MFVPDPNPALSPGVPQNYCMYSISVCVRIVLTFGILTLAYDWYFPTIGCVLLAIFNDGSMLTI